MVIRDSASLALDEGMSGRAMHALITDLYPICRSITGAGIRETLDRIAQYIPLEIRHVPTGTEVFDWVVPKEWNIRDAYIKDVSGRRVVDWRESNLHVVNYSVPIRRTMSLAELRPHLWTLPEHPDWIPYRTSYYNETWGFCLTHNQLAVLPEGDYEVCIDSSLEAGHLTYGEYLIPGTTEDEVLLSCHACHPSLCNDNLSGIAVATMLARQLRPLSLRYSYRFLFIPATIGSIAWLALNEGQATRIKHGLVLAGLGDGGNPTYKRSRRGDAEIDRAVSHVLEHYGGPATMVDFSPYGYDERQYCSPGFDLPVGRLSRTPHGTYPEYHTSADNLEFVTPIALAGALDLCQQVVDVLEHNHIYINQNPKCEPQLGRRGLYRVIGGQVDAGQAELAMLWVLNLSDGTVSLLDIAQRSGLPFTVLVKAATILMDHDLLKIKPGF